MAGHSLAAFAEATSSSCWCAEPSLSMERTEIAQGATRARFRSLLAHAS